MKHTTIALIVSAFVSTSAMASTTIVDGKGPLFYTPNYGNTLEKAIQNETGRVDGLSNDVYSLYTGKVDKTAFAADQARQDKDIHDTYVLANTKYTEAAGKFLESRVDGHDNAIADLGVGVEQLNVKTDATNTQLGAVQGAAQTANDRATNLESRADTVEGNVRETNAQLEVTDARSQNNAVRLDGVEATNAAQDTRIDGVSNTANTAKGTADRAAAVNLDQDATLADHESRITGNTTAITDNKAAQDQVNADQKVTDSTQDAYIAQNRKHTLQNQEAIAANNLRDDGQDATLADHDTRITSNKTAITKETADRTADTGEIRTQLTQKVDTGVFQQRNSVVDDRFADTDNRIAEQKAAQATTNKRVAQNTADIANHEQRITTLEGQTNAKFGELKSQIDDNRKRSSAAIAGVAGMANIPQVLEHQTFNIGAGVGNSDGESAIAVGFSARASQNVVVKASVSNDTQHNFVVGAGVAFGW